MDTFEAFEEHDKKSCRVKKHIRGEIGERPYSVNVMEHFDFNHDVSYFSFCIFNNFDLLKNPSFFATVIQRYRTLGGNCDAIMPDGDYESQRFSIFNNHGYGIFTHILPNGQEIKSTDLLFNGKIDIFFGGNIESEDQITIIANFKNHGLKLRLYTKDFVSLHPKGDKTIFISHDSRDKDLIARPLADELKRQKISVWYDEYSLNMGDSLRESIEDGLKRCDKCVLVLSKNFLSNDGWAKAEYSSIFTRERVKKERVILPIRVDVSTEEIYDYSPLLSETVASIWDKGLETTIQFIKRALKAL